MSPTRFAIRNPLVVGGIAIALCLFGLFAYFSLGVAIAGVLLLVFNRLG